MLIDIFTVLLTLALGMAAIYVIVSILLAPIWAVGAAIHVQGMRRVAASWWELPLTLYEGFDGFINRLTADRDTTRWERAPNQAETGDWASELGRLLLWILAIVGGILLIAFGSQAIIEPVAGGPLGEPVAAVVILLTLGTGAVAWVLSERYSWRGRPPLYRFTVGMTVLGIAVSWFLLSEIDHDHRLVGDYCAYGSVSHSQLEGCKSHVTANDVRSRNTPASHFAQGNSDAVCGVSSGPFCDDVISRRLYEDEAPPPGQ